MRRECGEHKRGIFGTRTSHAGSPGRDATENGKASRSSQKPRPSPPPPSRPQYTRSRHSFSVDCGDVLPHPRLLGTPRQALATVAQDPPDTHRLVLLGNARVGKSAILHRFLYDQFLHDYSATVEEFHRGDFDVGNNTTVSLDVLDTGGSFEFPAMRRLAITSGDAFVLVYSIDDSDSFEAVRRFRDDVLEARRRVPIVIVGNKLDLEDCRNVRKEMVEALVCMDWEHGFVECSAKTGEGVQEIFKELLAQANFTKKVAKATQHRRMSLPVNSLGPMREPLSPGLKPKAARKRNSCAVS
ncbi:ras-related protein Rap-2c-like [Ornithodoros turicata]|uniref:ras-related protein Rap-2c-like n=1 Tax=Ornithodoros turicata TaxID=34597 RepID=UPI00313A2E37